MKKVLLIEDDTAVRENTAELLELSEYVVRTASNGKAGVAEVLNFQPDIIICDIMMPIMDGYGVLEELSKSEETRYIPFIFLSAKTERQDIRKGMNLGADDYLTKPFEESELISAIESRLAKAAILKEKREEKTEQQQENEEDIRDLNELKNFFFDNGEHMSFKQGENIYEEGNHANCIFLIEKGVVKNHKLDEFGKELITALYKEDDFFGYSSFTTNSPYQESATAVKQTTVYAIAKDQLKDILEKNHKVTLELIELLTDNISDIKDQLLQMAYGSVRKKTAATILQFADKLRTKPDECIKISRSDLASVAGIATESLIRTLSELKKEGLIEIEGRNIKLLQIDKLQKMN
ncbi:response regulator [Abyssalbus ytuae]|uniref:Response regulator n=1 Tax=Abyssalbus ytuae TaxID=2926907 RepID=A0A9E6ZNG2_9FLAO|nr:response regulator [Abyssalbus ytuae]UOB17929.1 response regulator [Abyssalbus ytuae]